MIWLFVACVAGLVAGGVAPALVDRLLDWWGAA